MEIKKYHFGPAVFSFITEIPLYTAEMYERFRTDDNANPDFIVEIVPLPESVPYGIREPIQTAFCGNRITAAMNRNVISDLTVGRLMYLIHAANLFPQKDAFVLHASYIVRDGRALLFSAPSGTGKSTQADLWNTYRGCEIVNSDRVIISREKGQFFANGAFISGSSGICRNVTVPLGNIVLLEQASRCAVKSLSVPKRLERLLCESSFDRYDPLQYVKMLDLVSDILNKIPVICYGCTKGLEAVEMLENYL